MMDAGGDNPFSCFDSDSEEDADDSCNTERNGDDNCTGDVDDINEKDHKNTCAVTDDSRRRHLVEDANIRQIAAKSAAEAHRNRIPLCSPDFEVFDTDCSISASGGDDLGGTRDSSNGNDIDTEKGMGLRARRKFSCGDEILREHAAMRVPNQQAASSRQEAEALHLRAVKQSFDGLSPETQKAVLNLSNSNNNTAASVAQVLEKQVLGVYQTNSFLLGGKTANDAGGSYDQDYGGLFLTIARINHSCRPNANHFWRSDLQMTVVFATRDIEIGEEICTTYGPSGECLDTQGRRSYLFERFSFECGCDMCAEGNQKSGDDRMVELNSLQNEISFVLAAASAAATGTGSGDGEAEAILESVERCLVLLKEQGFNTTGGAFVKPILHYGYQASLLRGEGGMNDDSRRLARSYLTKELVATENGQGVGSADALKIQEMLDALPVT